MAKKICLGLLLFVALFLCMLNTSMFCPVVFADSTQIVSTFFPTEQQNSADTTNFCDTAVVNNLLYVANSKQESKIDVYDLSLANHPKSQITLQDIYYPTKVVYNYFTNKLFFTDINHVGLRTIDDEYFNQYYEISDLETSISMLEIFSFTISMNGTIFALTQSLNHDYIIIYKKNADADFILLENLSALSTPLDFTSNSKVVCDTYGKNIWFNIENTIYQYNIENGFQDLSFVLPSTLDNIVDIKMDFFNSLYILTNSESNQKSFIKSNSQTYSTIVDSNNKITANGFCLNYEDGSIFTYSNIQLYNIKITTNNQTFFTCFDQIENDLSWQNVTPTSVCTIVKNTSDAVLYPYENLYKQGIQISANTKFVLLNSIADSMFDFVLLNSSNQKNIVGFIKKDEISTLSVNQPNILQVVPIFSKTTIYTYPSTLLNDQNNEITLTTIISSSQNTAPVLTVLSAPELPTDFNNVNFIAVKYGNYIGYVDKNMVMSAANTAISRIFISNAKISESTDIYSDFNLTVKSNSLDVNTAIQVEKIENGIAKIYWLNGNEVFVGYVSTKFVNDGNLTTTQIIGIIIMSAALLTTALVLIIRHHRRKKLKKQIEQTKQALDN